VDGWRWGMDGCKDGMDVEIAEEEERSSWGWDKVEG
jgi:hypothetical protein